MRVERIGFTAVKGGRHVSHARVRLARTGPVGDRAFCLLDSTCTRVLRTVEHPALLQAVTHWQDGVLSVELAGEHLEGIPEDTGDVRTVDYWGREALVEIVEGPWAAAYARLLAREVVLARPVTTGAVVYGAAVSIVTTGALRWLAERAGQEVVEPERLRSTLLVDTGPGARRAELDWVGRHLVVGEASLRVISPVSRCAVIDLDPETGRRNRSLLRAMGDSGGGDLSLGVDAVVTTPGLVHLGDACRL